MAARSVSQSRDHRTSFRRILSVLKHRERTQWNRTQHGLSRLTAISDAGSTPAASTNNMLSFNSLQTKRKGKAQNIATHKLFRIK